MQFIGPANGKNSLMVRGSVLGFLDEIKDKVGRYCGVKWFRRHFR
jgi:hypothetical protein